MITIIFSLDIHCVTSQVSELISSRVNIDFIDGINLNVLYFPLIIGLARCIFQLKNIFCDLFSSVSICLSKDFSTSKVPILPACEGILGLRDSSCFEYVELFEYVSVFRYMEDDS